MGYESYLRKQRISAEGDATDRPENIVIRLSLVYLCVFKFESSPRFRFSLKDFSFRLRTNVSKVTVHGRIQHL
jgi:hypothetical protein